MTDYFASLLQQTGIKIKPDPEAMDQNSEDQLLESYDSNYVAPAEFEEHEIIELSPSETERVGLESVPREVEPPVKEPLEERHERVVIGEIDSPLPESSSRSSDLNSEELQDLSLERSELKEDDGVVRRPQRDKFRQNQPAIEETQTRETKVREKVRKSHHSSLSTQKASEKASASGKETESAGAISREQILQTVHEEVRKPHYSSLSPQKASEKAFVSGKETGSVGAISREQILQTVYEEVRGSLASQTAITTEEHRSLVAAEVIKEVEQSLPEALDQKQDAIVFQSRDKAMADRSDEAGIVMQHFHLSIGPISVSIEEPKGDLRSAKQPPRGDTQSSVKGRSSRLKRHYIFH